MDKLIIEMVKSNVINDGLRRAEKAPITPENEGFPNGQVERQTERRRLIRRLNKMKTSLIKRAEAENRK